MSGTELRILAEGLRFPEGPVAMPDGSILLVEIAASTLTRVAPDGTKSTVATPGGGPNGIALGPEGKIFCCNNGGFLWHEEPGPNVTQYGTNSPDGYRRVRRSLHRGAIGNQGHHDRR